MSSIRQKSPVTKGFSTPEGSLSPSRSLEPPADDIIAELQHKQRRGNSSSVQRINGTVIAVLSIFAFIYSTVTLCVVGHPPPLECCRTCLCDLMMKKALISPCPSSDPALAQLLGPRGSEPDQLHPGDRHGALVLPAVRHSGSGQARQ